MAYLKASLYNYLHFAKLAYCQSPRYGKYFLNKFPISGGYAPKQSARFVSYILQSLICQHLFSRLGDGNISTQERHRGILIGILTPLFDDLHDEEKLSLEGVQQKLQDPNSGLAGEIYHELRGMSSDYFFELLNQLLEAQEESTKQQWPSDLTNEEIASISKNKGGTATLLFRASLDRNISKTEEDCIRQLGYLFQLCNDIFDLKKDAGQQVSLMQRFKPKEMEDFFRKELINFHESIRQLHLDANKEKSFVSGSHAILSRAIVCLGQYKKLGSDIWPPNLEQYHRKQLICDMEKPNNIWASFRETLRLNQMYHAAKQQA